MKFHKSQETIDAIVNIVTKKNQGAYLRFGDGDVNLANNESELHQNANFAIGEEMREAFRINHPNVLKTLPLYCNKYNGLEKGMYPGFCECSDEWVDEIIKKITPYWGGEINDVYSHCFLHYTSCENPKLTWKFLNFLESSFDHIIFVGNRQINKSILEKLISHNNTTIIPTAPTQSYYHINSTYDLVCNAINSEQYTCVITFMGCAGRILQKRMWNNTSFNNSFAFDFGSLMDAVSNINSREWIKNFDLNRFLSFKEQI